MDHLIISQGFVLRFFKTRFLEYGAYKGHFYGTSLDAVKDVLNSGKICVIEVEPHVSPAGVLPQWGSITDLALLWS